MKSRVSCCLCLLLGTFVFVAVSVSWGWEFRLNQLTANAQEFNLYQTGSHGFFGPYNVDNFGAGDHANQNFWWGFTTVSGSSARAAWQILYARPELRVNSALAVKGDLWIGPYVPLGIVNGAYVPMSTQLFTTGWVEATLPWGKLSYGKLPFGQACGLQFAETTYETDMTWFGRTVEGLDLQVPYGPFTLRLGVTPYTLVSGDPWSWGMTQFVTTYDPFDTSGQNTVNLYGSLAYAQGSMEMGLGNLYRSYHWGPEGTFGTTAAFRAGVPPNDTITNEGWAYFKYCNGRFFFNAEADWFYRTIRFQSSLNGTFYGAPAVVPDGSGRNRFAPRYVESWRYMAEFGGFWGPLKISFLYTYMPGLDRRHGVFIDKQSFVPGPDQSAAAVFRPYATMLPVFYHSGTVTALDMNDAVSLAARLDYALAANLDFSVSVLNAKRVSHGYLVGFWRPSVPIVAIPSTAENFAGGQPAVPDNDLGTEVNVGVRWKLLENWMVKGTWGYFWPGKWWNFACADKSVPGWLGQLDTVAPWGINPDRTIDPVGMLRVELWTFF